MKFAKVLTIAAVAALTTTAVSAGGMFKKDKDAVNYRQSAFTMIRFEFGNIGDMLKGKVPYNQEQIVLRAEALEQLSKLPWKAFDDKSTAMGGKVESSALPKIWQDKGEFEKIAKTFQKNAKALAEAARSGDKGAIKKAVGGVGKTCKGCHDNFKD